jgi:ubiquinone/menaquinone biosynthesis C-methylase UbiE
MTSDKPMPNWSFRGMAFFLRLMERFKKPRERLEQIGLRRGQNVLEYGCGAGSFTIPAARIVEDGTIYAADIHPLATEVVAERARKENLGNVRTILTDRDTGLPDESIDVVLLYDTLHMVRDKQALLQELHRVLKPAGFLSADHQHTAQEAFLETMATGNLFSLESGNGHVFNFCKA